MMQADLAVDFAVAANFCRALACDGGGWTFQTFDDSPRKSNHLARVIHSSPDQLEESFNQLKTLNDAGAGIFVTVNLTDGGGRAAINVIGLRALFVDADKKPMPDKWHADPDIIVRRDAMHWHAYWLLTPEQPLGMFTPAQKRLSAFYGTDPIIHDLPRVMRVPGFIHRKADPCAVELEIR